MGNCYFPVMFGREGGLMSLLWMAVGEMPGEIVRCPGGAVDRKQVGKSHMQTRF